MLHIVNLEEIHSLLLKLPKLIDRLERKDPEFVSSVRRWLTEAEEVFVNNRMPLAGNIAALRGTLDATQRGVIPAGIVFHGRATTRKIREATAADVVRHAGELISTTVQDDIARVAEAERLGHQLAALAKAKGLLSQSVPGQDRTQRLKNTWTTLTIDPDLAPGTVRLESLVGPNDALIVLDRALTAAGIG